MKALTFTIELLEPLLIANPVSGDENSATGLSHIPGSVLRGALAHAFTKGKRGDLGDAQFKYLFFGDVQFLNAYPVIEGRRGLPMPQSWRRSKDASEIDPVIDLANPTTDTPREQLKRLSQTFTHIQPPPLNIEDGDGHDDDGEQNISTAFVYEPDRRISVHILQQDRRQAVQTGTGTIFRYDALAAGECFGGVILSEDDDTLNTLAGHLRDGVFKLGKSRSAGYGAVAISNVKIEQGWREYEAMPARNQARVVVTLLSDAIVRDPDTGAFAATLGAVLGMKEDESFARTHIGGGFNLAWGLPMPQAHAIQAGSVFVFERTEALMSALRIAEQSGVGERRIEGFGRIAIDWHTAPQLAYEIAEQEFKPGKIELVAGSAEYKLAQQMANRMWRSQLDGALRDTIGKSRVKPPPQNAQLSRMRVLMRDAWRANDATLIGEVLKEPDKDGKNKKAMKRHARDQFEKARISVTAESPRLIDWLRNLAASPHTVWAVLEKDRLKCPEIGGAKAEDPPALEYAARLIDGVLRKAAREGTN